MTIKEFEVQMALGTLSIIATMDMAANPNTSKGILNRLSRHKEVIVRRIVASNPGTPVRSLSRLLNDTRWNVYYRAQVNLKSRNITL